ASRRASALRLGSANNYFALGSALLDPQLLRGRRRQDDGHRHEQSTTNCWRCAAAAPPSSLSTPHRGFHSKTSILLAPKEQRQHRQSKYRGNNGTIYNNNNNNNRGHRDNFSPHMEKQIREHINSFPIGNSTALSAWHRTAVELVMDLSKLWGRNRQSVSTSPEQLYRAVLLANGLVAKILSVRESELDNVEVDRTLTKDTRHDNKKRKFQTARKLTTELLVQTVALGFSRCDPKIAVDAAHKAQQLLDRLEGINIKYQEIKHVRNLSFNEFDIYPNMKVYNHVLSCWSRSLSIDSEKQAIGLLQRMKTPRNDVISFPRPDIISYNNILNLYATRGDVDSAEAMLNQLEESENEITADVYSYTTVMKTIQRRFLSKQGGDRSIKDPKRAEELLARLVRKYEESGFTDARLCPTAVTFGTVLSLYAAADRLQKENLQMNQSRSWLTRNTERSSQLIISDAEYLGWGAENAERVLEWIIGISERERRSRDKAGSTETNHHTVSSDSNHDNFIRPSVQHFVTAADAWAKARRGVEGAERCERLKKRNLSLFESTGYSELKPNLLLFGAVIDAWARAIEEEESAEHAEGLLDEVEKLFLHSHSSNPKERLSNIVYNQVIDAWSRRSEPARAEQVLRRMKDNYLITNNEWLRPDVISYTGVMKAYVNNPMGGEKALELLDEMRNECANGNRRAKPDTKAFAVAMHACIKSGRSADAERIFSGIDDAEKTTVMFNTVLTGYKNEGRGDEAENLLRKMIALNEEGINNCFPNTLTYSLCIDALSKSKGEDRVARARMLMNEVTRRYRDGDSRCKPSTDLFNTLALVISNSDIPNRENEVLTLFEAMESNGCSPSLVSFNILIKTCSIAEENNAANALQIAASAFNSLDTAGFTADSVTFVSMFRAILNLMNDSSEKIDALAAIFRKCCDGGFLNQHIINILAEGTSEDELHSITGISTRRGPDELQIESVPNSWSRNASIHVV
ncbi:hypothetical protein ACHAWC_005850, partial [Mediolabrus comicus]